MKLIRMALALLFLGGCATLARPTIKPSLFKPMRTIQVTPDEQFRMAGFVRANYVPATDRVVVVFGTQGASGAKGDCADKALGYKEYTLEMEATGVSGLPFCGPKLDIGSLMVDNSFYLVIMDRQQGGGASGWRILKYDAVTWEARADILFPLRGAGEPEVRVSGDPLVAYVNDQLDISSGYKLPGVEGPATASHHQFFSTDGWQPLTGTGIASTTWR